ncbi:MAG: AarF/UbiB family protein, partial [Euryarchaeota archaeon]
ELDLRLEAAAGDELRTNFGHDQTFKVPKMDWKRTNRRVLTVERVDGLAITNGSELREQGYDTSKIVTDLARVVFLQVFRDGFFHADLHPGNIFITSDLSIRPVDFGIMGRIDRPTRLYLAEILMGFLNRNYEQVSRAHFKAGYVPSNQSEAAFAQAARAIAEPILELPLKDISLAQLLAQLFRVTERFKMETQPQLLLLQKTMLVAEGVGRDLHPETNMWELARPLITQWVNENMSPETQAADLAADARKIIENLPNIISKMTENSGPKRLNELKLHEDTINILTKKNSKQWVFYTSIVIVLFALAIS